MLEGLKEAAYLANMELPRRGLVTYTWGNAIVEVFRERGLNPGAVPAVGAYHWMNGHILHRSICAV